MRQQREGDNQAKRDELARVDALLAERRGKLEEMTRRYAAETSAVVSDALYGQMRQTGREIEALEREYERLRSQLAQQEMTPEDVAEIQRMAAEIRDMITEPDFEMKRRIMHALDVRVELVHDENNRGLRTACYLTLHQELSRMLLPIQNTKVGRMSSSTKESPPTPKTITFSAVLTIEGK